MTETTAPRPTRESAWYANPAARQWRAPALAESPRAFHRSVPGYRATPLIDVPALATELGVGKMYVKDESQRLGLPAFKILGASYAIARALSSQFGADATLSLEEITARLAESSTLRLSAATDGNHGRAVAHVARLLGLPATIYVPPGVAPQAIQAILDEGAELIEPGLPYDAVVDRAAADALADEHTVLIQDTSWEGYEHVPQWIVDGYQTLTQEIDEQLDGAPLDLIVVPAGVGSLAQAVVHHYRSTACAPTILVVEPDAAPAVTTSLNAGGVVPVRTGDTAMTGLNCGTVSEIAWPTLRDGVSASITIADPAALRAVDDLERLGVDSGPCGAAALAGLRAAVSDPARRAALDLDAASTVILVSSEGRAANPKGRDASGS
jgi:diaminopropionate ammonia-lyase